MGYFAHRELLVYYLDKHCQHCVHANGKTGDDIIHTCAVLQLHMVLYGLDIGISGYEEEDLKMSLPISIDGSDMELNAAFANSLELLIPENRHNGFQHRNDNLKCNMFVAAHQPKVMDSALKEAASDNT